MYIDIEPLFWMLLGVGSCVLMMGVAKMRRSAVQRVQDPWARLQLLQAALPEISHTFATRLAHGSATEIGEIAGLVKGIIYAQRTGAISDQAGVQIFLDSLPQELEPDVVHFMTTASSSELMIIETLLATRL